MRNDICIWRTLRPSGPLCHARSGLCGRRALPFATCQERQDIRHGYHPKFAHYPLHPQSRQGDAMAKKMLCCFWYVTAQRQVPSYSGGISSYSALSALLPFSSSSAYSSRNSSPAYTYLDRLTPSRVLIPSSPLFFLLSFTQNWRMLAQGHEQTLLPFLGSFLIPQEPRSTILNSSLIMSLELPLSVGPILPKNCKKTVPLSSTHCRNKSKSSCRRFPF